MKSPLTRKLFMCFALVVVLSLSSVSLFIYHFSSEKLNEQSARHLSEIIANAAHHTDLYLKAYERSTLSLLTNPDVKSFLDAPPSGDYEAYALKTQIRNVAIAPIFIRNPEVAAIYVVDYAGRGLYYTSPDLPVVEEPSVKERVKEIRELVSETGRLTMLNTSLFPGKAKEFITLARKIRGQESVDYKGILAFEIKSSDLSTLWSGVDLGDRGFFLITDAYGRIVHHPDKRLLGSTVSPQLRAKMNNGERGGVYYDDSDGERRMYVSETSEYSGWNLAVSIPVEQIEEPIQSIRYASIASGVLTLLLALWISYRFGRSITRPIQILKNGMRQTKQGNWLHVPVLRTKDELEDLTINYNTMVTQLSELMESVYRAQLHRKDAELERERAELQALQLQINPHFLYNTLESVICYAVIQQSKEITEMVYAISQMFRYSIQTQLEETAVVNELRHLLSYMTIMEHRLGRSFELDVQIPPPYLLKKMVRLTLQPLVENIFQHGFSKGIEAHHYIRLDAYSEKSDMVLSVRDNGIGIAPARLLELRSQLELNRLASPDHPRSPYEGGIGLMNVHRRIQLVFGEQYGISVESAEGEGTTIRIRVPDVDTG